MDVYKIGVSIALTNSITPALTAMAAQFVGLNNSVALLNSNLGRLKQTVVGVVSILGGVAIFEGMKNLAKHGADVNHQLEMMKIAGMDNAEIQSAIAQSMKTSSNVLTTSLSENLKHVAELRYAFGDTATAMHHLDEVSKANSVLNSVRGGGKDQVWELVKALEMKGTTTDPTTFSHYVDSMTKVVVASRGKVTPEQFMSTFKYGRTAMLGWDENFITGYLPRLIQSMATGGGGGSGQGGPGNALMTGFQQMVSGKMGMVAAKELEDLGLATAKRVPGTSKSLTNVKDIDLFIRNPYEWIQTDLMPRLVGRYGKDQTKLIAALGQILPVRTWGQVGTEMGLQGRYMLGSQSPFEKDYGQNKQASGIGAYDELVKNDYPTVMRAFHEQFKNLLEVLGSPLIQPGGPVLTALAGITSAISSVAQFANAHPEGLKIAFEVLAALAGGAIIGGIVALGGALVGLVGVGGAIAGAVAGIAALAALEWQNIVKAFDAIKSAISSFIDWISSIGGGIKRFFGFGSDGSKAVPIPQNFNPSTRAPPPAPVSLSLNVDGHALAQAVSDQLDSLHQFPTGAPASDGRRSWNAGDHNYTSD